MKISLLALSVLFAPLAQAEDYKAQVITALLEKAPALTLVDAHTGKNSEHTLPGLLGRLLARGVYAQEGEVTNINTVSADCQILPSDGMVGYTNYDCALTIRNGDYEGTKNGYKSLDTYTNYNFRFKAGRVVRPGAKLEVLSKQVELLQD